METCPNNKPRQPQCGFFMFYTNLKSVCQYLTPKKFQTHCFEVIWRTESAILKVCCKLSTEGIICPNYHINFLCFYNLYFFLLLIFHIVGAARPPQALIFECILRFLSAEPSSARDTPFESMKKSEKEGILNDIVGLPLCLPEDFTEKISPLRWRNLRYV